MSGTSPRASCRRRRRRSAWSGSTLCASSCPWTSSQPSSARTAPRAASRPSRDGTGQHHGVAVDARPARSGGLVEDAPGLGARLAGFGRGPGPQDDVAEGTVVAHVARRRRQQVDAGAGRLRAVGERLRAADRTLQPLFHGLRAHALPARLVVHLAQVGAVAQPPRTWAAAPLRPARRGPRPRRRGTTRPRASAAGPFSSSISSGAVVPAIRTRSGVVRLAPGGLRMEEDGDHRLLRLPPRPERGAARPGSAAPCRARLRAACSSPSARRRRFRTWPRRPARAPPRRRPARPAPPAAPPAR